MSTKLSAAIVAAAIAVSACSTTAPSSGSSYARAGHQVRECERVAPTGSRLKTHVMCDEGGGYGRYKVYTWADLEKRRD